MIQQKQRILIVDDDPTNVSVLNQIFHQNEFELKSVESGQDALDSIESFPSDIVLLDVMMPGIDGYEVCQSIKKNKKSCYAKIIFVSAKAMVDDRLKGYQSGGDDYITKPFDDEEILAKVKALSRLKYQEELEQMRNDFFAYLSHEIRKPLNTIFGFSDLLKQSKTLSETEHHYIEQIRQSGQELFDFSRKVLILYEINRGQPLNKTNCLLKQILDSIFAQLNPRALEFSVSFSVDVNEYLQIPLDRPLMEQALHLFIEEMLLLSGPGQMIEVSSQVLDDHCNIFFQIQGVRIDLDYFKFMDRSDSLFTFLQKQRFHGINLTMAQEILSLHDGSFLASNTDQGLLLQITLPR